MLGPYACVLHALGNLPFYDGTKAYIMRQENDHYVYHNVRMVTIPNGCPATPENAISTKRGVQEVCEPTGGSILVCEEYV